MNLTDKGCSLSWDERPLGGKAPKPSLYGGCRETDYTKKDCKNEWIEHLDVLEQLAHYFCGSY